MAPTTPPPDTETIQRVLFLSPSVHVYAIPPLTSTKGYVAATWTTSAVHQFPPCRLRILETAAPLPAYTPTLSAPPSSSATSSSRAAPPQPITIEILLEDPASGALFAACPYTSPTAVEQVLDSSRFFAVRVVGEDGRKAVLGIGFEERSEAFDFGLGLVECGKVLGFGGGGNAGGSVGILAGGVGTQGRGRRGDARGKVENLVAVGKEEGKRDWSLKEGQTIHVDLGRKLRAVTDDLTRGILGDKGGGNAWIEPPSAGVGLGFLPPPPSARSVKEERRNSPGPGGGVEKKTLEELGFDDGEFGEFQ